MATEMIEIVSATRGTAQEFSQTALVQSLKRLAHDRRLAFHVTLSNSLGLPEIYNRRIQESPHDILVFVHDDVWIDDYFLADRVMEGLVLYHVISVAGNTRLVDSHVAWHLNKGKADLPHLAAPSLTGLYHLARYPTSATVLGHANCWTGCYSQPDGPCFWTKSCFSTRDFSSISTISISAAQYGKVDYRSEHGRSRLLIRAEGPLGQLSGRRNLRCTNLVAGVLVSETDN